MTAHRGHFRLESGYHGALWLDLDTLFAQPRSIAPFVDALAEKIRPRAVSIVCGPLLGGAFLAQLVAQRLDIDFCFTKRVEDRQSCLSGQAGLPVLHQARYVLPQAFASLVRDRRVAIVDDVMSAGSSLRATFSELHAHGAIPVVAGALLVLGTAGVDYFASMNIAIEEVVRDAYELWAPDECPLCAEGITVSPSPP